MHLDAKGTSLLCRLHRPLHGPAEADPASKLVGNTLCDERRVELGLLDLHDVELHLGVGRDLLQTSRETLALGALASNDDARSCSMHIHAEAVAGAFHLDAADEGFLQLAHQVIANLEVLDEVLRIVAITEPA